LGRVESFPPLCLDSGTHDEQLRTPRREVGREQTSEQGLVVLEGGTHVVPPSVVYAAESEGSMVSSAVQLGSV
jgi:hypothetical protein